MSPSLLARSIMAQASVEMRLALRRGESVLLTLVVPPALLAFLGSVGPLPMMPERALDLLVPGIIALAVISTAMVSLGIATAFERYYGVLKRLGSTPLPRSGLLLAKIASVLVIEALQVIMILAVAFLILDWHPTAPVWRALPALLLGTVCFASIGLLMAGTLRAETTLALANGLYLAFLLGGGLVIPVHDLPTWLQPISLLLPSRALGDATRSAMLGSDVLGPLVPLAGWSAITLLPAIRFFRWE